MLRTNDKCDFRKEASLTGKRDNMRESRGNNLSRSRRFAPKGRVNNASSHSVFWGLVLVVIVVIVAKLVF